MEPRQEAESKTRIRKAAFALMHENGYGPTSYTEIAQRASVGRPLVQRHFPKKEMFVLDLIGDAADLCRRLLAEASPYREGDVGYALHLTQLYLSLMFSDANMVRLTGEVLADRRLSTRIIEHHYRSSYRIFPGVDERAGKDACLRSMGATYEVVEDRIAQGAPLDADGLACQTVGMFLVFATDAGYREACARMRGLLLPRATVDALVLRLVDGLSMPPAR